MRRRPPSRAAHPLSRMGLLAVAGLALHTNPGAAQALDPTGSGGARDRAIVGGDTGGPPHGRVAVNIASGAGNQQAGSLVLATGGAAGGSGTLSQAMTGATAGNARPALAVIEDGAFAGAKGAISVNIIAGDHNQQGNLALVVTGVEGLAVSDTLLSQTRASPEPSGSSAQSPSSDDVAALAPGAFAGSQGLLQVNLTGGERNSSANIFALTVSGGGHP